MKHFMIILALMAFVASANLASTMPVAGTTSGTWATQTGSLDNVWYYANGWIEGNDSYVAFQGDSFTGNTPYDNLYLGFIALKNKTLTDGFIPYEAGNTLNFAVDFTVPGGGSLSFQFPLTVHASMWPVTLIPPSAGTDVLLDLPTGGSQSMTVGGYRYTLNLQGFFQYEPGENQVAQIHDHSDLTTTPAYANLYGNLTSVYVPDAGSTVMLLGGALFGMEILRRRFRP